MTSYYPSQAGYATTQPVMYGSNVGYAQPYGTATSYVQPAAGVIYHDYSAPSVLPTATPMVMQPGYAATPYHHHFSLGNRIRRFFGLAPSSGIRYKSDRATWGFMGYSRRQRYIDARTGGEVDRQGRPVYRV